MSTPRPLRSWAKSKTVAPQPHKASLSGMPFLFFGGVAMSSAKPLAMPVAAAAMALVAAMTKVRIYNNSET